MVATIVEESERARERKTNNNNSNSISINQNPKTKWNQIHVKTMIKWIESNGLKKKNGERERKSQPIKANIWNSAAFKFSLFVLWRYDVCMFIFSSSADDDDNSGSGDDVAIAVTFAAIVIILFYLILPFGWRACALRCAPHKSVFNGDSLISLCILDGVCTAVAQKT